MTDDEFNAEAIAIVLTLSERDPFIHGPDGRIRCALCYAVAPGGAATLAFSQHGGTCAWARARKLDQHARRAT